METWIVVDSFCTFQMYRLCLGDVRRGRHERGAAVKFMPIQGIGLFR
jgi:hypothetical protein